MAAAQALADVLHRAGPRNGKPFVPVCAVAIPETLLEPALLGWEDRRSTAVAPDIQGSSEPLTRSHC
jgi:DNA-binding NtrC family response regulator